MRADYEYSSNSYRGCFGFCAGEGGGCAERMFIVSKSCGRWKAWIGLSRAPQAVDAPTRRGVSDVADNTRQSPQLAPDPI